MTALLCYKCTGYLQFVYHVRLVHELLSIGFTAKGVQGTPQLAPAEKTTLILGAWLRKNESSVFAPVCSGKNSYIKPCFHTKKKKKKKKEREREEVQTPHRSSADVGTGKKNVELKWKFLSGIKIKWNRGVLKK